MARSRKAQVKKDIEAKLVEKGLTSPVYQNQLCQYMEWYEKLEKLNEKADALSTKPDCERLYIACLGEARQIQKTMQNILDWLGVTPENNGDYDVSL